MIATIITLLGVTAFIASNPGFVAWVLGGLVSTIAALLVGYYGFINAKLNKLDSDNKGLSEEIKRMDNELVQYKEHVGAGDKDLKSMNERMKEHMDREEREVWSGMRELKDMLMEMQLENTTAHATITTNLAVMETRVITLEKRMPNGQIDKLVTLLGELVEDQDRRYHESARDSKTRIRPKGNVKKQGSQTT